MANDERATGGGQERREHPRIPAEHRVVIHVVECPGLPQFGNHRFVCATENLSFGGLQFRSKHSIPVGTVLKLDVTCPRPTETFQHVGRVVWARAEKDEAGYALGVFFTDSGKTAIAHWGRRMSSQFQSRDNR